MIVSNATPLIAFARIGELTSLEPIVHRVMLPETVWSEVTAVTAHPGAETIGQATGLLSAPSRRCQRNCWPYSIGEKRR
jgi:hypothetical protein